MSDEPTSGVEGPPSDAVAGGRWTEVDGAWEDCAEQAMAHDRAGDAAAAAALWAEGLRLARSHFGRDDPRLATSLANQALVARRDGREAVARQLFDEALLVWDSTARWIEALQPERRARSSLFHLRLEVKHPGGYDRFARTRHRALAAEGRAALLALSAGKSDNDGDRLARWRGERPRGYGDARKLLAAVRLIAQAPR